MHHSVATVPLAVTAAMLYARFAASSTRPGLCCLFALIPVLALLLVLPFLIPLYGVRGLVAFFLVWLGEFKLLLLAFGHGPLDPHIRPLPFVFTAALPVKLRRQISKDAAVTKTKTKTKTVLLSSSIKFAATAAIVHHPHHSKERTHPYAAFVLFGIITYCILDSVLPCVAATGRALGMELEPQFNKPYLAASLQDFWGRRWNLMVSAVLRPSVYNPVRAHLGVPAGVLATFLVSGLMHEVMAYYLTFRAPTGQVTAFFVLHGASMCAERWCARRWSARPPRVVATPLVVAFVVGTACWLFLPAIFGDGMDDLYLAEAAALVSSFRDVGARFLGLGSLGS
jgi:D-alanyl-lipoteichoic acid acyltransferase DltB (MBOAT superfamily)